MLSLFPANRSSITLSLNDYQLVHPTRSVRKWKRGRRTCTAWPSPSDTSRSHKGSSPGRTGKSDSPDPASDLRLQRSVSMLWEGHEEKRMDDEPTPPCMNMIQEKASERSIGSVNQNLFSYITQQPTSTRRSQVRGNDKESAFDRSSLRCHLVRRLYRY